MTSATITLMNETSRTAPAAQSFACLARRFQSGETRSTMDSIAVLTSSKAKTKNIQMTTIANSVVASLNAADIINANRATMM